MEDCSHKISVTEEIALLFHLQSHHIHDRHNALQFLKEPYHNQILRIRFRPIRRDCSFTEMMIKVIRMHVHGFFHVEFFRGDR